MATYDVYKDSRLKFDFHRRYYMKNLLSTYFLFITLFAVVDTNASTGDYNFTEPAVKCDPFVVEEPFGGKYKVKIDLFTNDIYQDGTQKAVAVFSDPVYGNDGVYVGTMTLKGYKGTFTSHTKRVRIDLTLSFEQKSVLRILYFEDGKWISYKAKPSLCNFTQYGSEGVHN